MNLLEREVPGMGSLTEEEDKDEALPGELTEEKKAAIAKGKQVARATINNYKKVIVKVAETQAFKDELSSRDVIITTFVGCAKAIIRENADLAMVIWQEAAKSGVETLAGLAFFPVPTHMSGDHHQGRPFEEDERHNNFANQTSVSFYERLMILGYPHTTLEEQYRMIPPINDVIRKVFYLGKLQTRVDTFDRPTARKVAEVLMNLYNIEGSIGFLNRRSRHMFEFMEKQLDILEAQHPTISLVLVRTIDGNQGEENGVVILCVVSDEFLGYLQMSNRQNMAGGADKQYLCLLRCPGGFPVPLSEDDYFKVSFHVAHLPDEVAEFDWTARGGILSFPYTNTTDYTLMLTRPYNEETGWDGRRLQNILDTSQFQLEQNHETVVNHCMFSVPNKARVQIIHSDKPTKAVIAAMKLLNPHHPKKEPTVTKKDLKIRSTVDIFQGLDVNQKLKEWKIDYLHEANLSWIWPLLILPNECGMLNGPCGTGKTVTDLVVCVLVLSDDLKVLVVSTNNQSTDYFEVMSLGLFEKHLRVVIFDGVADARDA
ncbi:hypothetical protein MMC18_000645 [Xylographa bjoerkii]|nr:hypothetical protein [Xylographa bjoerkii]